jgi:hypothetical protein
MKEFPSKIQNESENIPHKDILNLTEEWFDFVLKNKNNKNGEVVKILEEKFNVFIPFEGQESLPMTVKMEDGQENEYTIIKNSEGSLIIKPLEDENGLPMDEELADKYGIDLAEVGIDGINSKDIKEQVNEVKHRGWDTPGQAIGGKAFMTAIEEGLPNLTEEDKLRIFEEYRKAIKDKTYIEIQGINEEMIRDATRLNEEKE